MAPRHKKPKKTEQFTVDAGLLQELGERLIGRAYVALAELIKNAFDADAVHCRVVFEDDTITIEDDGHGMSEAEFRSFWMRVGTTHKVDERSSRHLKRPMTGSKGIGRLSVQFLANEFEMDSTADPDRDSVWAYINWQEVNSGDDLQSVNVLWDSHREPPDYPNGYSTGTRILLRGLRSEWDADAIKSLGDEIWMLRSPFRRVERVLERRTPQDFYVDIDAPKIQGSKDAFDTMQRALFKNWKARIQGSLVNGRNSRSAKVGVEFRAGYPKGLQEAAAFRESISMPVRGDGLPAIDSANFQILVFRPEGAQMKGIKVDDLRKYLQRFGNISVYDAGFRLPYYGSLHDRTGEDWLNVGADQGRRITVSYLLPERLKAGGRYLLDLPAPGRIFGSVEIDTNHERQCAEKAEASPNTWLQIQSGRDRLSSNVAFEQLRDLVRFSIDFYASRYRVLADRVAEERVDPEAPSLKFSRAITLLKAHRAQLPPNLFQDLQKSVKNAQKAAKSQEDAIEVRTALLAPLATAGMTALALNHELARERQFLQATRGRLRSLALHHGAPELSSVAEELHDADLRFSALQDLFGPLLSDEDRTATERLAVEPVVRQVVRTMKTLMPGVTFAPSGIAADVRFPVGSYADWSAVLQNALSNAWNAMLDAPHHLVAFDADRTSGGKAWLRISDTGVGLGVPLDESATLFEPFERHLSVAEERRSLMIGGQGLGLTIVRMIARRRSADVAFAKPRAGFSTTLEISWRVPAE